MYELKTKETDVSVIEFIESVDHPKSEKTPTDYWTFYRGLRP